jgi:cytochrome c5
MLKINGKEEMMKKTTFAIVLLIGLISILAVGCASVAPAESNSELSEEIALEESSCSSCGLAAPTEPTPDLSAGKALVEGRCALCHGIEVTTTARHSREAWTASVDHMIQFGMTLSDQQKTTIIDYLSATYSNE